MRTIIAALGALALAGCASNHTAWMKADGGVATPEQRQLAMTVCEGEMEKARMAARQDDIKIDPNRGLTTQSADVYRGCMAQQGFAQVDVSRYGTRGGDGDANHNHHSGSVGAGVERSERSADLSGMYRDVCGFN